MKRINFPLCVGGLLGFLAVALGAVADHGLRASLSNDAYQSLQTALRYQLVHSVLLVCLGFAQHIALPVKSQRLLAVAAGCFGVGVVLFSGGILGGIVFALPTLLHLTPVGGVLLMLGWLLLAVTALVT